MPVYEYQCKACSREFEYQQRMSDPDKTTCEVCGGGLERLISRTAFQLKGSGWYKDLYASQKPAGDAKPAAPGTESSGATDKPAASTTPAASGTSSGSSSSGSSSSESSGGTSSGGSSGGTSSSGGSTSSSVAAAKAT